MTTKRPTERFWEGEDQRRQKLLFDGHDVIVMISVGDIVGDNLTPPVKLALHLREGSVQQ